MRFPALVLALVAAVMSAWFLIGARQGRDLTAASTIILQSSQPRQLVHAASLLDSARFLNPDTQVRLWQAELASSENRAARAVRIAEAVTRDEPQNALAWKTLAQVAGQTDPKEAEAALAQIRKLVPPVR